MRILVIDDSTATRAILRRILQQAGCEVSEAADGREGLDSLRRLGQPDLALVDWNMPEMSGLEFVRAVRGDPAYAGLRLLLVTAEEDPDQVRTALGAGADEVVRKPLTLPVLREKLHLLGCPPS